MKWRLKQRIRIAVLGVPLAMWGGGCDKKPRERTTTVVDAALAAPAPARDAELTEPTPDAAVAELPVDGGPLKVPAAHVKLPHLGPCGGIVQWCAPKSQSASLAPKSAKTVNECPSRIRIRQRGESFDLDQMSGRTKARQAKGADACCYEWVSRCAKGRPLRERGQVAVARVTSEARGWSARPASSAGDRARATAGLRRAS